MSFSRGSVIKAKQEQTQTERIKVLLVGSEAITTVVWVRIDSISPVVSLTLHLFPLYVHLECCSPRGN